MKKNIKYILAFLGIALLGGLAYLFSSMKKTVAATPNLANSAVPTTSAEIEDIKKRLVKLEDNFEE